MIISFEAQASLNHDMIRIEIRSRMAVRLPIQHFGWEASKIMGLKIIRTVALTWAGYFRVHRRSHLVASFLSLFRKKIGQNLSNHKIMK